MKSTNYYNTFIQVAEDCPTNIGEVPPIKGDEKSVASLQFELISQNPYKFTSDEVLFSVFATRKNIPNNKLESDKQKFFSKGQPCFRSSPLTKRYGWGIHSNHEGKIAIFGMESEEYKRFANDKSLKNLKAMRARKA